MLLTCQKDAEERHSSEQEANGADFPEERGGSGCLEVLIHSSFDPGVLDPPSFWEHDSIRSGSTLSSLGGAQSCCPPLSPATPSDLYTQTSPSAAKDNNTLST